MVNLDDPKEFFRVIVEPNLQEFYAKEGDLPLGVNSILTLDALVGVIHQENCRKIMEADRAVLERTGSRQPAKAGRFIAFPPTPSAYVPEFARHPIAPP
jgi:hypothetical protein